MILYPPSMFPALAAHPYYGNMDIQYKPDQPLIKATLLGFWPCSFQETYYSVGVPNNASMRVVPTFWCPLLYADNPEESGSFLYFRGCDDGHSGMKFDTKEQAVAWLDACEDVDFYGLIRKAYDGHIQFHWFN